MSFHARLAEDADYEYLGPSEPSSASSKYKTAFAKLIRYLSLQTKQFGIDLLTEFQVDGLSLERIEQLEAKGDHFVGSSPAFKHLDGHLKYYCELCNKQLPLIQALNHLTQNEHMFRYTEFKYPMEYRRIETLEEFDDQLVAIKSLLERISQMLTSFFDVEPKLVNMSNKPEDIKRYITKNQRRLYLFRPNIRAKLNEPPVSVKKQVDDELDGAKAKDDKSGGKSNKTRLVSDTSMEDLSQIVGGNKRQRSVVAEEEEAEDEAMATMETKMSESMLEAVSEEDEGEGQLEGELNMSQASSFDVLFDEENDDYGCYIERLNDRLGSAAHHAGGGQLAEGYLLAFNEFFDNLEISNDLDTLLRFKQVLEKQQNSKK